MVVVPIAFAHFIPDSTIASLLAASVRSVMPGLEIVQLTDRATPAVPGVDTVLRGDRVGETLPQFRLAQVLLGLFRGR